jgi:FMN phosphatase YigB (HAD superfamily)
MKKEGTTKRSLKLLLVDFDGVISNGKFYSSRNSTQQIIGTQVARHVFTKENTTLLNEWMRGKYSSTDIHTRIAKKTGLDVPSLDRLLEESVRHMPLNTHLLQYITLLRKKGVVVSLFTNNMDIFDRVSRGYHNLDAHFDFIYSSSAYGQLKLENDTLLRRAMQDAKVTVEQVAFVDDSQSSYDAATGYGVATFLYAHYNASQSAFEMWLENEYSF